MRKRIISLAAESQMLARCLAPLEQLDARRGNLLRVLTYHRVCDPQPGVYGRVTVTPREFQRQMAFLAAQYRVISMADLLKAYRNDESLPPRAVLITFDDAYTDFATAAWPILQRYDLPVTLFVPTAFPDCPERIFWWDWLYYALSTTQQTDTIETPCGPLALATTAQREQAFSQLRGYVKSQAHAVAMDWVQQFCSQLDVAPPPHAVLSWQALRELASAGVTLGAHTQTHPMMDRLSPWEMEREAAGSRCDLEQQIGSAPPIFAYPSGGLNHQAVCAVQNAGFALAFTTQRGINRWAETEHLQICRINVGQHTTLTLLRTQLVSAAHVLSRRSLA